MNDQDQSPRACRPSESNPVLLISNPLFILNPFVMFYVIKKGLSHICYTLLKDAGRCLDILESDLFLMVLSTWVLFQHSVHEGSELVHLYSVCDYFLLQSGSWYSLSWTTSMAVWFLKHQNDYNKSVFPLRREHRWWQKVELWYTWEMQKSFLLLWKWN